MTTTGLSQTSLIDQWYDFLEEKSDPRTKNWFLVDSFPVLFLIIAVYVSFCTKIGPRLMRDRQPFELKGCLTLYNVINIGFSMYMCYEALQAGWLRDYSFTCQPVDYSLNPKAIRMANVVWVYYMVKFVEMLDTVFFVLRKKNRQVSFLHLYHHSLMPLCAYIGTRFLPGGHGTMLGLINSFVHVIMYTYYLMTSLGTSHSRLLWWKKYVTMIQLLQFVIVFVHMSQVFFRECNYPKSLVFLLCLADAYMAFLFARFYIHNYVKKKNEPHKTM